MITPSLPRLAAMGSLALLAGCLGVCDGREVSVWTYTTAYGGSIDAPADLELPARIDTLAECGSSNIATCAQDGSCAPSFCVDAIRQGSSSSLVLEVSVRALSGPEVVAVPSPSRDVAVGASIVTPSGQLPLTVVSGTVNFVSVKGDFDARLDLVLATPDGRTITVTGVRYAQLNGHYESVCES